MNQASDEGSTIASTSKAVVSTKQEENFITADDLVNNESIGIGNSLNSVPSDSIKVKSNAPATITAPIVLPPKLEVRWFPRSFDYYVRSIISRQYSRTN